MRRQRTGQGRRFRTASGVVLEALEPRVMLSSTMTMLPMCDTGDDGSGDGGSDSSAPPADTQPVDTQPVDTQPTGTSGSGDGSGDDGSGEGNFDDGGVDDSPPPVDVAPLPPGRPARVTLQMPTPTSVFLSWQEPTGDADSFLIERLGATGGWKTIATVDGGTRHFTNKGLVPGGTYSYDIVAENEGGDSDESNDVTVTIAADADPAVIGEFGKLPGGGASVPLVFFDGDGTKVTLTMSGPGVGAVRLTDAGYGLTLTGTTINSRVSIVTAKTRTARDDGRFDLSGMVAGDGVGSVSAGTTDVRGDVSVGNAGVKAGALVSLKFGVMGDVTVDSAMGIKGLTVQSWTAGELEGSSVGTLAVTGGKGIVGNFGAEVMLSDANGVKMALGKLTVAGVWSDSAVRVMGNIGTVTVGGMDHVQLFAGIGAGVEGLPATGGDFVETASTINLVQIKGKSGSFIDSDIAAGAIVRVTMPASAGVVGDGDMNGKFGFATLVGNVRKYKGPGSVGNYVAGVDSMVG